MLDANDLGMDGKWFGVEQASDKPSPEPKDDPKGRQAMN